MQYGTTHYMSFKWSWRFELCFLDAEARKGPKYMQTKYVLGKYEDFRIKLMAHPLENVSQQDELPPRSSKNEAAILCAEVISRSHSDGEKLVNMLRWLMWKHLCFYQCFKQMSGVSHMLCLGCIKPWVRAVVLTHRVWYLIHCCSTHKQVTGYMCTCV